MSLGFDTNTKLSFDLAKKFKQDGYDFAMRYVGRVKQSPSIDIDVQETKDILSAGLDLGIYQHCPPKPGIVPSRELGKEYGYYAALFSDQVGYEPGCGVALDLEDVNPDYANRQQDIIDYCNAWYDEVVQAYDPAVYVGFNTFLSGKQLYQNLKFKVYIRSFSKVPEVYKRGYAILQCKCLTVNGIQIDTEEATVDNLGGRFKFMRAHKTVKTTVEIYSDGSIKVKEA